MADSLPAVLRSMFELSRLLRSTVSASVQRSDVLTLVHEGAQAFEEQTTRGRAPQGPFGAELTPGSVPAFVVGADPPCLPVRPEDLQLSIGYKDQKRRTKVHMSPGAGEAPAAAVAMLADPERVPKFGVQGGSVGDRPATISARVSEFQKQQMLDLWRELRDQPLIVTLGQRVDMKRSH